MNDRELAIENAVEQIENEFILVGSTAIEDKLQENVADVIRNYDNKKKNFYLKYTKFNSNITNLYHATICLKNVFTRTFLYTVFYFPFQNFKKIFLDVLF